MLFRSPVCTVHREHDQVSKGSKSIPALSVRPAPVRAILASPVVRYGTAIGVATLAVMLRLTLDPVWGLKFPYITLFPAIMLSAWLGGLWPGIVTTALAATAAEYFWIEPTDSWAVSEKGDLLGVLVFIVVGVVISALNEAWRRGAAAVAESEERLYVTLTSIGDAVLSTDRQGRVIRLNPVAEALTGWTQSDAAGRPFEEVFVIINEESRRRAENPIAKVLRDAVIVGLANHTVLISKDGREIPVDDSAAPIKTADGSVAGVIMVFRDVSERRRAERERIALLEKERTARTDAETAAQQLRLALEAGHMGTWQFTIGSGDVKWSPGLEAIHGLPVGSFPGTFDAFRSEIHPEDRDRVLGAISEAIEERRDHHVEYRIVRTDGAVRWVEGRGQLFYDAHGRPDRMVGVCSDVTDRRQAEERFRLAVEAAPTAMIMVDQRGRVVMINALTEQLLGYARDEIVGQPVDRLVPPRFRDRHPEHRTSFFMAPRQRPMGADRDLYALRKDGSEVPVEIGLSPVETMEGLFVLAAVSDITERKRNAALLQEAVRARDDFLATASHELRNPVNALQLQLVGALRGFQRDTAALTLESVRDQVAKANVQVHRITRLIDNLLDVSRITSGPVVLDPEEVDLKDVVRAVVDQLHQEVDHRQITLRAPEAPIVGHWDRLRLEQVVTNLLSNAIKYGKEEPIEISLDGDGEVARLSVTDHGIGINEDQQSRLFMRFERAVTGQRYGGFGLGLWISRQLVEAMQGRISVESRPGRGSTFMVTIPVRPSPSASVNAMESRG
jgi:PAS domain S-box-containing protein